MSAILTTEQVTLLIAHLNRAEANVIYDARRAASADGHGLRVDHYQPTTTTLALQHAVYGFATLGLEATPDPNLDLGQIEWHLHDGKKP